MRRHGIVGVVRGRAYRRAGSAWVRRRPRTDQRSEHAIAGASRLQGDEIIGAPLRRVRFAPDLAYDHVFWQPGLHHLDNRISCKRRVLPCQAKRNTHHHNQTAAKLHKLFLYFSCSGVRPVLLRPACPLGLSRDRKRSECWPAESMASESGTQTVASASRTEGIPNLTLLALRRARVVTLRLINLHAIEDAPVPCSPAAEAIQPSLMHCRTGFYCVLRDGG